MREGSSKTYQLYVVTFDDPSVLYKSAMKNMNIHNKDCFTQSNVVTSMTV